MYRIKNREDAVALRLKLVEGINPVIKKRVLRNYFPLSYFSFQPALHDWCNKDCGMCYPFCGMVYIKEPLPLIGKSSPCGGSGFPLLLFEWSFIICLTPYKRK